MEEQETRFCAAFDDHYGHVLAYLLRRSSRQDAEEVAANTFLVAWRRVDDLPDDPLPWLYGVARRQLANHRRAATRHRSHVDIVRYEVVDALVPDPADQVADRSAAVAALAVLRPTDQEVLRLVAWEGLDPRQAAAVLGCTTTAFKVRLHRARGRLDRALERTDDVGSGAPDARETTGGTR